MEAKRKGRKTLNTFESLAGSVERKVRPRIERILLTFSWEVAAKGN
jgi:hypothetical protein